MELDVRELSTEADVRALEPLLHEYTEFVSGEILTIFGIDIPAKAEVARTLSHIDQILPPKGQSFAAYVDGNPEGMVFIRPVAPGVFEIKRLYVRPSLRGTGAGRSLVDRAVAKARELGGLRMVLDSTKNLTDAARLYRSMGFVYGAAYEGSDHGGSELAPHMIFMEKQLA